MKNEFLFVAALVIAPNGASAQDSAIRANLANPIIVVKDLDASEKFYTQCFGFSRVGGEDLAQVSRPEGRHAAIRGEVILSLIIEGIEEVLSCAKKAGDTILNDLEPSSSGHTSFH